MPTGKPLLVRLFITSGLVGLGIIIILLPSWVAPHHISVLTPPIYTLTDSGYIFTDSGPSPSRVPTDSTQVTAVLESVLDPCLGLSIVDLGFIYHITTDSLNNVTVIMIFSTPACPYVTYLAGQVLEAIKNMPGVNKVKVKLDLTIPWSPSRLSDRARRQFWDNVEHNK
ncbi:hypothetical protein CH330_01145 [candidate division WOR-3 bacterium JGI_Cruoil_03_51_56]|uniref:MIP18 family-like domain-containing protein n=1 Tax=candidate division WOR-3 bacterium JGI_Cruoil_03_51_56 TaxID=1973747 RepID=A0A235BXZ2_UNCW3|nr:MAG: hypothetical protein CH330_01145 [candidate division WOR-3 bacterium JGI_Cruoil_03_51_56]